MTYDDHARRTIAELAARCEAQAAVIERVSATVKRWPTCTVKFEAERALAAAPEHTGPDDPRVETFANALDAANARVAELEDLNALANAQADLFSARWHAANARADEWKAKCEAAERAEAQCRQNAAQDAADSHGAVSAVRALIEERKHPRFGAGYGAIYVPELETALVNYPCDSAESKAAALRAEVARLTEQRERLAAEAGKLRGEYSERNRREQSLRDEASSLRAEVERLRATLAQSETAFTQQAALPRYLEQQLSTATELLGRWCTAGAAERLKVAEATRAFLSTAPAPTEREKAERAVKG